MFTLRFTLVLVLLALAAGAPAASAAPPANDDFAAAVELSGSLPISVAGTTSEATAETGEPGWAGSTVWYAWTPAADAAVRVETCGAGFDSTLQVFTGAALEALVSVADNDDACGLASRVGLEVTAGTTYRIAVGVYEGGYGGPFTLAIVEAVPPANDDFAAAQAISGENVTVDGTTVDATDDAGAPLADGGGLAPSVWYAWSAPADGTFVIETCGSPSWPQIVVFELRMGLWARVVSGDGYGCRVFLPGRAGTQYRIAAGDWDGGTFTLRISRPSPPGNDSMASAVPLDGASVQGTSLGATTEPFEEPGSGASVWYSFVPAADDRYQVDTCGSEFGAVPAVFVPGVGQAQPLTADGYCEAVGNVRSYDLEGGTRYLLRVNGYDSGAGPAQGTFTLTVRAMAQGPDVASVDFGAQAPGTIGTAREIGFANQGSFYAYVERVQVVGEHMGDFILVTSSCPQQSLPPGARCAAAVRFAPSAAGPRRAALQFVNLGRIHSVTLTGAGAVPAGAVKPAVVPSLKLTCKAARSRRTVACRVRSGAATGALALKLTKGRKSVAKATGRLRRGSAKVTLKARRRLARGTYLATVVLKAVAGRKAVTAKVKVKVR